ncbi:MAG: polymer-forming cytoskeletal protein [Candidatus Dormibacteraeota bacterium]|nr:polymer-forming cytoskeletal protein [Candidatus Dormibacteraeota bacterium]
MATDASASKLQSELAGDRADRIGNRNGSAGGGVRGGALVRSGGSGVTRSSMLAAPSFETAEANEVTQLARSDSAAGRWMITGRGEVLGSFTGEIDCASDLLIGKGAEVTATIRGLDVVVAGLVRGNITASGRLQITASGRVEGDARVGSLIVHEGGVHRGAMTVYPEGLPEEAENYVEPVYAEESTEALVTPITAADRVRRFWGEFF